MDKEILQTFAEQIDADPDIVEERWHQRPDLIMEDIFRVRDLNTGQIGELRLFDVQRRVVHAYFYGDGDTLNLYKGRRIGYSFIVIACYLLEAMFYPESFYPLVSRSLSQSKDRISDIQDLVDNARINIPTEKENTDYIELWNGSAFKAYSSDSDTSRGGDTGRSVLLDEMAFIEDEEGTMRAFEPFLALGEDRTLVEVSTPNTKNDLFMQDHRNGDERGDSGILSIKQPTFENADEIDVYRPLTEQDVTPVRPDLNVKRLETTRMRDPEGFGQEYLCRPIVDEYFFFDPETVEKAMEKEHEWGWDADKHGRRIMAVDIGLAHDDTAISIMEQRGSRRFQIGMFVVTRELMRDMDATGDDPGNANHVANLIVQIDRAMSVDHVIIDQGGQGYAFKKILTSALGREIVSFDFSDVESVADMMGDMNLALRQGDVSLIQNDLVEDQLKSIVKQKKEDWSTPRFSGKDESESGKDDAAIATVMSAYPPKIKQDKPTSPSQKDQAFAEPTAPVKKGKSRAELEDRQKVPAGNVGATTVQRSTRGRDNKYNGRNPRSR